MSLVGSVRLDIEQKFGQGGDLPSSMPASPAARFPRADVEGAERFELEEKTFTSDRGSLDVLDASGRLMTSM